MVLVVVFYGFETCLVTRVTRRTRVGALCHGGDGRKLPSTAREVLVPLCFRNVQRQPWGLCIKSDFGDNRNKLSSLENETVPVNSYILKA